MAKAGDSADFNPFWEDVFSGKHPELRRGRNLFRMISPTATRRCNLCYAAFDGFAAPVMRAIGRGPWRRNPQLCELCETVLQEHRGGAEMDIAVLYADVRGSTQIAARMTPTKFGALMQRFFEAATKVLTASNAIIDKMVGDEVIGIYPPALTGSDYRQRAVAAGLELLRATGHGDPGGPWLPIGVGVHAGIAFLGSIGVAGGAYEFAALGDTMNFGARLVAAAKTGELVMSETVWKDAAVSTEPRSLELKGYPEPVQAHVARVKPA